MVGKELGETLPEEAAAEEGGEVLEVALQGEGAAGGDHFAVDEAGDAVDVGVDGKGRLAEGLRDHGHRMARRIPKVVSRIEWGGPQNAKDFAFLESLEFFAGWGRFGMR